MPYPYKEVRDEGTATGTMQPPPGKTCDALRRNLGKPPQLVRKCLDGQVAYEMTTVKVDITPSAKGCDIRLTTTVTTIVTAERCDRRSYTETVEPAGPLLQEYNHLLDEIEKRERAEKEEDEKKKKKGKG